MTEGQSPLAEGSNMRERAGGAIERAERAEGVEGRCQGSKNKQETAEPDRTVR